MARAWLQTPGARAGCRVVAARRGIAAVCDGLAVVVVRPYTGDRTRPYTVGVEMVRMMVYSAVMGMTE